MIKDYEWSSCQRRYRDFNRVSPYINYGPQKNYYIKCIFDAYFRGGGDKGDDQAVIRPRKS